MAGNRLQGYAYLPEVDEVSRAVNDLRRGHLDVVGDVTVAGSTTSTTINNFAFGPGTVLLLVPLSQAAAAQAWWLVEAGRGYVTIGHPSAAARSYRYVAIG